ncbi:MAG: LemA family protein [Candidatus Aureabacteria bacterium]|nr:LemA family protein [Candidatus Auribacterota bacterium]
MTAWIFIVVFLLVLWLAFAYNRLVRARNMVREAWSGIDVQLKRRAELIPNLIEVVKGYSRYERSLLEDITRARSAAIAGEGVAQRATAEGSLSEGLRRIFAVAENYPDLQANRQFLELQKNLVDVEDQIQYARRYYNGTVRDLNIRVESFPSLIPARIFGFPTAEYFELESATERVNPQVRSQSEVRSQK